MQNVLSITLAVMFMVSSKIFDVAHQHVKSLSCASYYEADEMRKIRELADKMSKKDQLWTFVGIASLVTMLLLGTSGAISIAISAARILR